MNEPNKQPIDIHKLAANAMVIVSPAKPTQGQKVIVKRLATIPKPTDNPPPKPEQTQGIFLSQPPQSEVLKKEEISIQGNSQSEKTNGIVKNLGEYAVKGGPGRPKKEESPDYWLEQEGLKAYARLPDGTILKKSQQIARSLMEKAIEGNLKAIEITFNRLDGKARQAIDFDASIDVNLNILNDDEKKQMLEMIGSIYADNK